MRDNGDLIEHYQNVVSYMMIPTIDPQINPWLQIYLPLAFSENSSATKLALGHALISVAAFHLAQTGKSNVHTYLARDNSTRKRSTRLLHEILRQKTGSSPWESSLDDSVEEVSDKCSCLAAAMSLITVHVISGEQNDGHIAMNLAKRNFIQTGGGS
ncbi:hypothetical protein EJ08DRAFT_718556 [Tothia fuscella]|uniref:Uncharacterized protein n=1 Tax=Tothia fuscella TaxID=1048955 RepID=A0A9P4NP10_9PEZI|nr:hypothetical protein EJ08DRAFT_718556 [Tothia fuscella]